MNMPDCVRKVISSHYEEYRKSVRSEEAQAPPTRDDSRQVMFNEVKELQAPFYDHYHYLSGGHRGFRSKQDVAEMQKSPDAKREPLLPIRQIVHIVDKSIRRKPMRDKEASLVEGLMSLGWFRDIYGAAASFYDMIMCDNVNDLTLWLKTYAQSPMQELRSFAYGIKMDLKAAQNAIAMDTSNGIVEGYVNKLKAVKRTMYGRASLGLLKRKMVFSDLCFN